MGKGKKLEKFLNKLEASEDQKKAFEEVFGNFKDVEDSLSAISEDSPSEAMSSRILRNKRKGFFVTLDDCGGTPSGAWHLS